MPNDRLKQYIKGDKPLTWVFTGDSITQGAKHTNGFRSYPEHFTERVRWELRRKSDAIINTGSSGSITKDILAEFDLRVKRFKPDVVSLMIGTNDAVSGKAGCDIFHNRLVEIIKQVRDCNAIPILNTPNAITLVNAEDIRKNFSA